MKGSLGKKCLDFVFYVTMACIGGVVNHMRGSGALGSTPTWLTRAADGGVLRGVAFTSNCQHCVGYWIDHIYDRAVMGLPTAAILSFATRRLVRLRRASWRERAWLWGGGWPVIGVRPRIGAPRGVLGIHAFNASIFFNVGAASSCVAIAFSVSVFAPPLSWDGDRDNRMSPMNSCHPFSRRAHSLRQDGRVGAGWADDVRLDLRGLGRVHGHGLPRGPGRASRRRRIVRVPHALLGRDH